MKRVFCLILTASLIQLSSAQQTFRIEKGTPVKTTGDVFIVLNNTSVVNNGNLAQQKGEGNIVFEGEVKSTISGRSITSLNNVIIAKQNNAVVETKSDVNIKSAITFKSGLFDASNSIVNLGTEAQLKNEIETSHLFASGRGYVQANQILKNPSAANPGNIGIRVSSPANLGNTIIKRGNETAVEDGNTSIARYFEVIPENNSNVNATVSLSYFDNELNRLKENSLSIFKNENGNWVEEGNELKDVTRNYISKNRINKLTKYTLFTTSQQVKVWPNPVNEFANVQVKVSEAGKGNVSIFDSRGRLVYSQPKQFTEGVNSFAIDMKSMAGGSYVIQTSYKNKTSSTTLVKE